MIQSYFYKDHLTSSRQNYKAFRGGLGLGESLRDVLHKKHEFHSINQHSWTYLYQTHLTNRDPRDINCKSAIVLLWQKAPFLALTWTLTIIKFCFPLICILWSMIQSDYVFSHRTYHDPPRQSVEFPGLGLYPSRHSHVYDIGRFTHFSFLGQTPRISHSSTSVKKVPTHSKGSKAIFREVELQMGRT